MIAIADSSALISQFINTDSNFKKALAARQELEKVSGTLYVPSEIFSETINILGKKFGHKSAAEIAKKIISLKSYTVIESTQEIREKAIAKFKNQPAAVSFTDCLVMAFADHFETKIIFGFDRSFGQGGYKMLG